MIFKYSDFRNSILISENLAGAKKVLKDTYVLNKAVSSLDTNLTLDRTGLFIHDKDNQIVKFTDLSDDLKNNAKSKYRDIKVSPEELRDIERHPKFVEIRTMLGDKRLGWSPIFTYLFFREGTHMDELRGIFTDMNSYQDLLAKLRRPIQNYIDVDIPNNTEQLIDDLEDIKRYRKLKKFIDEFNSELKRDYSVCPLYFKERLIDIASAFDDLGKSEGVVDIDKQRIIQKRFFDKIGRYKTVRELTAGAESFLKAESNASVNKFYIAIEKTNKKYGNYGVKIMWDEDGLLIMEVRSFAACKELFSNTSWCIAQYLGQWDSYVGGDTIFSKQYSILNFNLATSDNKSIIGITIDPGQSVRACHLKNDASASSSFRGIFNDFEKDLGLKKGFIWEGLIPMTEKEIQEKKKRIIANREIVKKGLTIEQIKKYIIEDGADVNAGNGAPIDNAVVEDDIKKIEFLLDYGASANLRTRQEATVNKVVSFEILKLLIRKGAEITPQVFKSLVEDEMAVRFCLDNGLDPNFEENMPMRSAIKNGNLNLVKILEEYNVNVDNRRQMNTKHAAEYEKWDVLEYFIEKGGNYVEGFDKVLFWIGHTMRIKDDDHKIEALDRLQKYVNDGVVEVNDSGYRIGKDRNCSLSDVITKFGSIRNWVVSLHPTLSKLDSK